MTCGDFSHISVMLNETLNGLEIFENKIYVDATAGGGGHTFAIANKLKAGKIFAFDKDPKAIDLINYKLKKNINSVNVDINLINDNFSNMERYIKRESVDGVLMDLGVSSFQLDDAKRGFSYSKKGPLDMRMSCSGISARDLVNSLSEEKLFNILKSFGEEKFAKKIARNIILSRKKKEIETTTDFATIIANSVPAKYKRSKNPCKKSFQAIRIAVNSELEELKKGLEAAFNILNSKGVLLVISFHSLEDKIVKNFYKEKSVGCICPKNFPICVCSKKKTANTITKKPICPTTEEIFKNKRARSAKLRILKKL